MLLAPVLSVVNVDASAQGKPDTAASVSKTLEDFGQAWDNRNWKPNYMRPLDDTGWKRRMAALRKIVQQGPAARADLVRALKSDSPPVRALAAQALGYCADPAAQPALAQAAEHDAAAMVRLYAVDSLGMLGGRAFDKLLQRLAAAEHNRDVQRHLGYAQDREGQALKPAVARQLREWKTSQLASAELGKPAPDFELTSIDGRRVRLSDYRSKSAVVLVFVYGDTWPVCHGQVAQLRDKVKEFKNSGAQLLVVDPHESWSAKRFLKDVGFAAGDIGYPLLLDPAQTASAAYGVAMQMRIHTELSNRPASFVIDRQGVIRYERRGQTFADRPSAVDLLREVRKLK